MRAAHLDHSALAGIHHAHSTANGRVLGRRRANIRGNFHALRFFRWSIWNPHHFTGRGHSHLRRVPVRRAHYFRAPIRLGSGECFQFIMKRGSSHAFNSRAFLHFNATPIRRVNDALNPPAPTAPRDQPRRAWAWPQAQNAWRYARRHRPLIFQAQLQSIAC